MGGTAAGSSSAGGSGVATSPFQWATFSRFACAWPAPASPDCFTSACWSASRLSKTVASLLAEAWVVVCRVALVLVAATPTVRELDWASAGFERASSGIITSFTLPTSVWDACAEAVAAWALVETCEAAASWGPSPAWDCETCWSTLPVEPPNASAATTFCCSTWAISAVEGAREAIVFTFAASTWTACASAVAIWVLAIVCVELAGALAAASSDDRIAVWLIARSTVAPAVASAAFSWLSPSRTPAVTMLTFVGRVCFACAVASARCELATTWVTSSPAAEPASCAQGEARDCARRRSSGVRLGDVGRVLRGRGVGRRRRGVAGRAR